MDFISAAEKSGEVTLVTTGRKSGKPRPVTIWITTDGSRVYIRSGQGLSREWPRNLLANPEATVRTARDAFKVRARHVTDAAEAHATTKLVVDKYRIKSPSPKGEQAVFELLPE